MSPENQRKDLNVIWCASFQMAWDALSRTVGRGPIKVELPEGARPMALEEVRLLTASSFDTTALEGVSFECVSGQVSKGILGDVSAAARRRLEQHLGLGALSQLPADAIVAYAHLRQELPFAIPFEPMPRGLRFNGSSRPILAFGILPESTNPRARDIRNQVVVTGDPRVRGPDGRPKRCVVTLATAGQDAEVVLAMLPKGDDLLGAWAATRELLRDGRSRRLDDGDTLIIPKMNFSLGHVYRELEGATVFWDGSRGPLVACMQSVDFRLDEGGAKIESHGLVAVGGEPARVIFDKPFLVAVRKKGAEPYLLMWIANDELLAAAAQ